MWYGVAPMNEKSLRFVAQHGRILLLLALVATLLLIGAVGEVAAHGPCHANPGSVPNEVCTDLPSQNAPQG